MSACIPLQTLLHQQTLLAQGRRQLEHKELLAAITQSLEPQFQASRPSLSLLIHRCVQAQHTSQNTSDTA